MGKKNDLELKIKLLDESIIEHNNMAANEKSCYTTKIVIRKELSNMMCERQRLSNELMFYNNSLVSKYGFFAAGVFLIIVIYAMYMALKG